jgi:hypothetical protein
VWSNRQDSTAATRRRTKFIFAPRALARSRQEGRRAFHSGDTKKNKIYFGAAGASELEFFENEDA